MLPPKKSAPVPVETGELQVCPVTPSPIEKLRPLIGADEPFASELTVAGKTIDGKGDAWTVTEREVPTRCSPPVLEIEQGRSISELSRHRKYRGSNARAPLQTRRFPFTLQRRMATRRVLLVVPALPPVRVTRDRPIRHNPLFTLPYLGLLSIGAVTPRRYDVELVNEHVRAIDLEQPADLVGITVMTPLAPRAYELADEFRRRGAKVILGGLHPTNVPQEAAAHADAVVRGEAERIWPDLLADFERGSLQRIYDKRPPFDLAELPLPARELVAKDRNPYDVIQATRGCVHHCDFCSVHGFHDGTYRVRPVAHVIDELRTLRGRLVMFVDDNLTANRAWARELFTAMIPLRKRWLSMATIKIAEDETLLRLARQSGCQGLFLGLETIDRVNLESVHKLHNARADFATAVQRIRRHGIGVGAGTVYGFDNDDTTTFDRVLDFAIAHDFSMLQVSPVVPFPGTRLREHFAAEGRKMDADWSRYDFFHVVFDPQRMSRSALVSGMARVRRDFYSWRSILRRVVRNAPMLGLERTLVNALVNVSYRRNHRRGYEYPP